jgi:CheY-like chemotaxis protein
VLAVDDNATNRKIVQHYVAAWRMRCDVAADAREAFAMAMAAAAAGDPYRLALLDLDMPGMDGVGLARAMRDNTTLNATRMILLTSLDRRFSPEERAARGLAATLTKPLRQQDLLAAMLRAVGDAGAHNPYARGRERGVERLARRDAPPPLPPMRILVAEDNVVNQRLIQLQLKKLGQNAEIAGNGIEVLEALERAEFDIVIMDCQMPEMDGYEATRRIRRHPRHGHVRVIAMTANAMQGDRDKCIEAGMDDYLSKPTRVEDLREALGRAAASSASPRQV